MISDKPKIDYTAFKLAQFRFRDRGVNHFRFLLRKLMSTEWQLSPLIRPKQGEQVGLQVLGEAIGFSEPVYQNLLIYHQKRLKEQTRITFDIYMLICIFFSIPFAILAAPFFTTLGLFPLRLFIIFLYAFVMVGIAMRLSQIVTLRYFSDSLCIQTLIFLIIELARCDNPLTPLQKRQLLNRTTFLAKATRSLAFYYNIDAATRDWARKHFRQTENFIQEREKWIIAPRNSTLEVLQQDFYYLALIYISGNFGDFKYDTAVVVNDDLSTNKVKDFFMGISRIVIGMMIPISGLLIIALRPDLLAGIIDIKVLALICIGWLLLAIDVTLKLGIVSSVIEIAKGIKELT